MEGAPCLGPALEHGCTVDQIASIWMNEKFLDGWNTEAGNYMIATVKLFFRCFAKGGGKGLPRMCQALRGWKRKAPSHTRLPLPWEAVA